jgi:PAS domain S-box-containing protein
VSGQIRELEGKEKIATGAGSNPPVGKILVVDDEPKLRSVLVESLRRQGYEVAGCSSGRDALAKLRERDFDLLLTDLMMPEMDGIALLKAALEVDPHLVGIIVTGQGTIQTAVDAMQMGAFDYVLKPCRMQTLMPVLTRAMNVRHLKLENVQLRETVAIHSLCQTITFTLDPQTVLSKLADAALQQSDADEVSILLPTSDGTELYVAAVRGEKRERLLGERVPLQESISSWVARERKSLILNGEVRDERFVALWPRPEIRSAVSVPMQVANNLVGIINLNMTNRLRPFTLGQMKALTILASTAAAALESASLYTQVQQAEKNYRSIFENAIEGVFQSTPEGRFITVNPSMARILRYESPAELIATITDIAHQLYVHPESRAKASQIQEERGLLHGFEFEAYCKDGGKIWLSVNRRSVRDEDGTEIYREGSIEDITGRKRVEARQARRAVHALFRADVSAALAISRVPLRATLESCATAMVQHLGAAFARIWTLNREEDVLELQASAGMYTHIDGPHSRVPVGSIKIGKIAEERVAHITNEVQTDPRVGDPEWARREGMVAFAGYPLLVENRMLGVMAMFSREALAEDTLDALASVADLISQGIERKRAEEGLRESEERYRLLFESSPQPMWVYDLETLAFLAVNESAVHHYGYSREDFLAMTIKDIRPAEDIPALYDSVAKGSEGVDKAGAWRHRKKDGTIIEVEITSHLLVFADRRAELILAHDITDRKQAEEALRESEARKRAILEASMDCIITMDRNGLVVDWNPAAEKTFGYTQEEVIGREMALLIIPQRFRDQHRQGLARYLATGKAKVIGQRLELSAKHRDGTEFPIELTITRIESKGAAMFTGYLRDITDRKKAENRLSAQYTVTRALAESNTIEEGAPRILQAVCESLGWEYGSLWTVDRGSNVLRCSQVWQNLGAESGDFESASRESVFAPGVGLPGTVWNDRQAVWVADVVEDTNFPRSSAAAKVGLHGACAFPIEFRSEILGVVEFLSRSIREPDPDLLAMMVTIGSQIGQFIERKRVEDALGESEEQLRQSQKLEAIGQLAGGVAHDFNNLLTAINGYSALARRRIGEDHPISSYLEEISKAGDRAANLTRQLLAFGRKQLLQPLAINLNDILGDMIKLLKRLIGEDIQLVTKPGANLKQIKADPGQLEQVLVNLVVNARDAMRRGGTLTIETANIRLDGAYASKHVGVTPGEYVTLAISDTGIGMDHETQSHIFEPFFTTKEKGKGTGLGLSTVYGIVRQSGGNIWVYSELGKGTTFKVYLPQVEDDFSALVDSKAHVTMKRGSETVLLVEDEEMVRKLASELMEESGYVVLSASGGEEAINFATAHKDRIDLLITDVVMPKISGKEVAEQLKTIHPETKVLFMSGYTDEAIVHHGIVDSHIAFIQKPFSEHALAHKIREILDSENGHK